MQSLSIHVLPQKIAVVLWNKCFANTRNKCPFLCSDKMWPECQWSKQKVLYCTKNTAQKSISSYIKASNQQQSSNDWEKLWTNTITNTELSTWKFDFKGTEKSCCTHSLKQLDSNTDIDTDAIYTNVSCQHFHEEPAQQLKERRIFSCLFVALFFLS